MAHLGLALLAFALVSSVGAGVALHQVGNSPIVAPHNGEACGHDHNESNEQNETGERNETGDHNETRDDNETGETNEPAEHASAPGQVDVREHNETADHDGNETAEHDDNGTSCEPNEVGDHQGLGDSESNETKDD